MRKWNPTAGAVTLLSLAVPMLACATGGGQVYEDSAYGAMTPEMAVEMFLQAANSNEYREMANLFGTNSGPAEREHGRAEVEQRMFVLASILQHASVELRRLNLTEEPDQVRVFADMTGTRAGAVTVPIITAAHQGRWFVEQIEVGPITGAD